MASEKAPDKQLAKSTEQYQLFEQASRPLFKKYEAAIREMRTRFEILDADLEYRLSRNPIHHIESRIKAPKSVYDKLYRYGVPVTLKSMEETIKLIRDNGLPCKVVVGGAVLTPEYAEKIGADFYAKDAKETVDIAKKVIG